MNVLPFLRPLVLAAALGLSVSGGAAAAEYTSLDAEASSLSFGYSQMNVKMDGAFSKLSATELSFDPAQPDAAKVVIEVPLSSIDAGYAEANSELEKEEWLALNTHPVASFASKKVEDLGGGQYQVTGDLSIKGNTREITVPFTFKEEGEAGVFDGSFGFQRSEFAVGEGEWKDVSIVADEIEIRFHIVARP